MLWQMQNVIRTMQKSEVNLYSSATGGVTTAISKLRICFQGTNGEMQSNGNYTKTKITNSVA
jgi:hypothetical protein